jgi:hypothetical protein
MIVIPASLRSDFIHMAGMTIHIALESTIHIVGIRTLRTRERFGRRFLRYDGSNYGAGVPPASFGVVGS